MKKIFKLLPAALVLALCLGLSTSVFSQPPPPDMHGYDTDQPSGGAAPVGSGLLLMLALGSLYAGSKMRMNNEECPSASPACLQT